MHWLTAEMYSLPIPLLEKMLRSVLVYVSLIVMLRVFGKRELAQLNPFDLVVLMTLSNSVQNAIIGNDNSLVGGLLGALTLLVVNYLVVRFLFRHRRLDQMVVGRPTVLIHGGHVQRANLAKELISEAELKLVAHRQGYELKDVEECVLEAGGTFYIRPKEGKEIDRHWAQVIAKLDRIDSRLGAIERKA